MLAVIASSYVRAFFAAVCAVPRDLEVAIWAFPFLLLVASRKSLFDCLRCHPRRRTRRRSKRRRMSTGGKGGGGVGDNSAELVHLAFVPRSIQ